MLSEMYALKLGPNPVKTRWCSGCNQPKSEEFFRHREWIKPWARKLYCRGCQVAKEKIYEYGLMLRNGTR